MDGNDDENAAGLTPANTKATIHISDIFSHYVDISKHTLRCTERNSDLSMWHTTPQDFYQQSQRLSHGTRSHPKRNNGQSVIAKIKTERKTPMNRGPDYESP